MATLGQNNDAHNKEKIKSQEICIVIPATKFVAFKKVLSSPWTAVYSLIKSRVGFRIVELLISF